MMEFLVYVLKRRELVRSWAHHHRTKKKEGECVVHVVSLISQAKEHRKPLWAVTKKRLDLGSVWIGENLLPAFPIYIHFR